MRNILFISPTGTMDNGAEISIFYLMEYLVKQGHKVINVVPQAHHPSQNEYAAQHRKAGIQVEFIDILKWWWPDAPGEIGGTKEDAAYFYRQNIADITHLIYQYAIDVVVTNTVNMFQGAIAAADTETPHIWLIHEFPEKEFAYYKDKIDFVDAYSDELFGVAGELEKELQRLLPKKEVKSFISYSEIDTSNLARGTKKRIVSVGRINERKNQLDLIKVFENLKDKTLSLLLIGPWDEDYKKILDDYIESHQLSGITFSGNRSDPWDLVTDQDLCVFTSKLETFGLVYAEAVLKGVPVIISDNPGHMSAYHFFGIGKVYHLGDQEELRSLIQESLNDFDKEHTLAQKEALNAREKYQINQVYAELIKSIENIDHGKSRAIRHIDFLIETNTPKSAVDKRFTQLRKFASKVINRFKRLFKTG